MLRVNHGAGGLHKTNMKWYKLRREPSAPVSLQWHCSTDPLSLSVSSSISHQVGYKTSLLTMITLEYNWELSVNKQWVRSCTREMSFPRAFSPRGIVGAFPDSPWEGCLPWPVWSLAQTAWPRAASHNACGQPHSPAALREHQSTGCLQCTGGTRSNTGWSKVLPRRHPKSQKIKLKMKLINQLKHVSAHPSITWIRWDSHLTGLTWMTVGLSL